MHERGVVGVDIFALPHVLVLSIGHQLIGAHTSIIQVEHELPLPSFEQMLVEVQ